MNPNALDARYVTAAAAALDLVLPPGHLDAVTQNLCRIAQVAAPMLELPLSPEDESAPVWRP